MEFAKVKSWVERVDAKSGRTYWGNVQTKETTWKEPKEVTEWRDKSRTLSFVEARDVKSGRTYYVCKETKLTTWLRPLGKIEAADKGQPSSSSSSSQQQQQQQQSVAKDAEVEECKDDDAEARARVVWVACEDKARGRTYFFCPATKETTWARPKAPAQLVTAEEWKRMEKDRKKQNKAAQEKPSVETVTTTATAREAEKEEGKAQQLERRESVGALSTAVIQQNGSVEGWASCRAAADAAYERRFCTLLNSTLECWADESRDARLAAFEMDALSSAALSDDPRGEAFLFVLEVSSATQTWFLGLNSIEDMQVWLEALQAQARKRRVASVDSGEAFAAAPGGGAGGRRPAALSLDEGARLAVRSPRRTRRHAGSLLGPDEVAEPEPRRPASFAEWAEANELGAFIPGFAEAGYDDLDLVAALNDDDLKEMLEEHVKVDKPGQRMKIVLAVRKLRAVMGQ